VPANGEFEWSVNPRGNQLILERAWAPNIEFWTPGKQDADYVLPTSGLGTKVYSPSGKYFIGSWCSPGNKDFKVSRKIEVREGSESVFSYLSEIEVPRADLGAAEQKYSFGPAAVSFDENKLAFGSKNGQFWLFDLKKREQIFFFDAQTRILEARFSANNQFLVFSSLHSLYVVDTQTGQLIRTLSISPYSIVDKIEITPDGSHILLGIKTEAGGAVKVWNPITGETLYHQQLDLVSKVHSFGFPNKDEARILVGPDRGVRKVLQFSFLSRSAVSKSLPEKIQQEMERTGSTLQFFSDGSGGVLLSADKTVRIWKWKE
jgi:WD40 repeat protein